MAVQIVLLRGINIGSRNRIAMPKLREALVEAGFDDARTYLQSGNIVLSSDLASAKLAREVEQLIEKEFGLDVSVVVRTRDELADVVGRNPLAKVATDPRRYQVTFVEAELDEKVVDKLESVAAPQERLAVDGREVYAWHPSAVARSKLWAQLAGRGLGTAATARNWTTVTKLLELADEFPADAETKKA